MKEKPLPVEFIESMAEMIKLIGHSQRIQILEYLDIHGESPAGIIAQQIDGQQSAVSQHLNRLRIAGVLSCHRDGKQILYRIAEENALTILHCMRNKYRAMNKKQ